MNHDRIERAVSADFGVRSRAETAPAGGRAGAERHRHAYRHLASWMRLGPWRIDIAANGPRGDEATLD